MSDLNGDDLATAPPPVLEPYQRRQHLIDVDLPERVGKIVRAWMHLEHGDDVETEFTAFVERQEAEFAARQRISYGKDHDLYSVGVPMVPIGTDEQRNEHDYNHKIEQHRRNIARMIATAGYMPEVAKNRILHTLDGTDDDLAALLEFYRRRFRRTSDIELGVPAPAAFRGLAGEFVDVYRPTTEADPVGLLVSFLVVSANCLGPTPRLKIGELEHRPLLNAAFVGESGISRKGTTFGVVKQFVKGADPTYYKRFASGAASGPGLLLKVNDKEDPVTGEVSDRRALFIEEEFSRILKAMTWTGSTLSENIRLAFDGGVLEHLTVSNQLSATNAHVAMMASTTPQELAARLNDTEVWNGFVNRFLWIVLQEQRSVPIGPSADPDRVRSLQMRWLAALSEGRKHAVYGLTVDAEAMWIEAYVALRKERRGGVLDVIAQRGPTIILRLALVYAILDEAVAVGPEHLAAAMAVWRFSERSARKLFNRDLMLTAGGRKLYDRLEDAGLDGLRGRQVALLFGNKPQAYQAARQELIDQCLAVIVPEATMGRPAEVLVLAKFLVNPTA